MLSQSQSFTQFSNVTDMNNFIIDIFGNSSEGEISASFQFEGRSN